MTRTPRPSGDSLTALVTGATGFIGSHLVERLVAEGWDVHIIARPASRLDALQQVAKRIVVHRYRRGAEQLVEIVDQVHPTVVFHLATYYHAVHAVTDIEPMLDATVVFATQLVDAMVRGGCYRLVNASTAAQHYQGKKYSPAWLHASMKHAYERILQYYVETTPLRVITLELHDTYGPRDPRPKLFTLLRQAAFSGVPLNMSPGKQRLNLMHIDDVVRAFLTAGRRLNSQVIQETGSHELRMVASREMPTLREVVRLYERVLGRPVPVNWGGRPYRPREIMLPYTGGRALPGWKSQVSLLDGLKAMESLRA